MASFSIVCIIVRTPYHIVVGPIRNIAGFLSREGGLLFISFDGGYTPTPKIVGQYDRGLIHAHGINFIIRVNYCLYLDYMTVLENILR